MSRQAYCGVGLGLRWDFLDEVIEGPPLEVAFWEVSPENHMRRGGYLPWALAQVKERYRLVTHGLTMSLGALDPPPDDYLAELKREIERMGSPWHSDHLCLSTAGPRVLHDLLPLQLRREAALRAADRIRAAQDRLGVPMAFENISWYAHLGRRELDEVEFLCLVQEKSQAGLLLDVNNVYVNSQNHGFDPYAFIASLPLSRVTQLHVAGHTRQPSGMLLDTHGAPVIDPVRDLLRFTLERTGPCPVLLERDNEVPPLSELLEEVASLKSLYDAAMATHAASQPSGPPIDNRPHDVGDRARDEAFERAFAELTCGPEVAWEDPAALADWTSQVGLPEPDRAALLESGFGYLGVYRDLVRGNLYGAIELAIPRALRRLGDELFLETFDAWLSEVGPRTHYLRDATRELLDFAEPRWAGDPRVPPYLLELARHEALRIEVGSELARPRDQEPRELSLEAGVAFIEAARLVRYQHRVHCLSEDEADTSPPEAEPCALLVYRSPSHEVRYLELTPLAASILERLLAGEPLGAAIQRSCQAAGAPLTEEVITGAARVLADLAERGALLGPLETQTEATQACPENAASTESAASTRSAASATADRSGPQASLNGPASGTLHEGTRSVPPPRDLP
ncbi:MAG: DUF692 family protein [Polyangiaceae bacterium]|nr:DUF692 family protein [Polyangiaceae bacterium]